MTFLLDTNILAEVRRTTPDPDVAAWYDGVDGDDLYLSVMVIGEIRQGVEARRRRDPAAAETLEDWLRRIKGSYADRILPITTEIAEAWGRMNVPDRLPVVDGLLAATASVHRMTLVTRNTADVERTGVELLNPFEPR